MTNDELWITPVSLRKLVKQLKFAIVPLNPKQYGLKLKQYRHALTIFSSLEKQLRKQASSMKDPHCKCLPAKHRYIQVLRGLLDDIAKLDPRFDLITIPWSDFVLGSESDHSYDMLQITSINKIKQSIKHFQTNKEISWSQSVIDKRDLYLNNRHTFVASLTEHQKALLNDCIKTAPMLKSYFQNSLS